MLFHITAGTPPNARKPNDEGLRAMPSQVFLDFDPILPGWPVPDRGPRADDHVSPSQRRRNQKAKRRSSEA